MFDDNDSRTARTVAPFPDAGDFYSGAELDDDDSVDIMDRATRVDSLDPDSFTHDDIPEHLTSAAPDPRHFSKPAPVKRRMHSRNIVIELLRLAQRCDESYAADSSVDGGEFSGPALSRQHQADVRAMLTETGRTVKSITDWVHGLSDDDVYELWIEACPSAPGDDVDDTDDDNTYSDGWPEPDPRYELVGRIFPFELE